MQLINPAIRRWIKEGIEDPESLWEWAAEDLPWFKRWDSVFESDDPSFQWFPGAQTNLAFNALFLLLTTVSRLDRNGSSHDMPPFFLEIHTHFSPRITLGAQAFLMPDNSTTMW